MVARNGLGTRETLVARTYRSIRRNLAHVPFLRSTYHLLRSLRDAMLDSSERGRAELELEFESRVDPWDYATAPYQVDRILSEVAILESVRPPTRFQKALEIGCAEGLFTEKLAPICESLLGVDICAVALHRTQTRLEGQDHVHFALSDLRIDPISDGYDLIVVIHALEYIRNPFHMRRVRAKLIKSLRSGGYLFYRDHEGIRDPRKNAWWGRLYATQWSADQRIPFAAHQALNTVRTDKLSWATTTLRTISCCKKRTWR